MFKNLIAYAWKFIFAVVIALFLPCAANAEFPLGEYRRLTQDPTVKKGIGDYVTGVGRGIFWSNVILDVQEREPLFCMPKKLHLDDGIIQSLLDQEIRSPSKGSSYSNDTPIELIMTNAFIRRFPCGK